MDEFEPADGLQFFLRIDEFPYSEIFFDISPLSQVAPPVIDSAFQAYFTNAPHAKFLRISGVSGTIRTQDPARSVHSRGRVTLEEYVRENLPAHVAPTRVSGASLSAESPFFWLEDVPSADLNRCTRRRSSRGPRSARSCCPPAAARGPCAGSGTPACGRDRRASIGILP